MNPHTFTLKKKRELSYLFLLPALLFLTFGIIPAIAQNTIKNGTTVVVSSGTSVHSATNLILENGGTLNNQGTVILKQNLINQNASPNSLGSGTLQLSGTTYQSINGQNIIQNLTVNNTAGVGVGGNTQVNGTFTLTNGTVSLRNNNLLLGPSASFAGTPSASKMIVPEGTGELRKEFSAAGTFTYPVGDTTGTDEYSPVTLNFVSGTFGGSNYAGVNLVDSKYPHDSITGSYISRYWNVTQSNITNFACNATFNYLVADVNGTEADMYSFKVSGDYLTWVAYYKANTGTHQLNAVGLATFSSFTGAQGGIGSTLPPANRSLNDYNVLFGETKCYDAQKTLYVAGNGTTFYVQNGGSANLIAGQNILMYPGTKVFSGGYLHAFITTTNTYCTNPDGPGIGGGVANNETVTGVPALENGIVVKIYPNPTPGLFTMELSGVPDENEVDVTIYSMRGEKILHQSLVNEKRHVFSIENAPIGIYNVRIFTGNNSVTSKIVKGY
jgi:hypothetical protein